jgi:membrane protein
MASTAAVHGGERGREADSPKDIPSRGWLDIVKRVGRQLSRDRVSIIAAGVAFYALLALFPALAALVSLYGLAFDPSQVREHASVVTQLLPPDAADILVKQLDSLTQTDRTALGIAAIGGLLVALWSSASGVKTLMEAMNVAYHEEERRGFFKLNAIALLLTLGAIVASIIAITIIVALTAAIPLLGLGQVGQVGLAVAQLVLLALLMAFGLAVIYRFGPSRESARWAWVSPGAGIATLLWLLGSALFSLYVKSFASYNETYGSMGAIVILLTWFLLTAYAILIGAEVNSEMERQTRKDTTRGEPAKLGERGAYAADTVGE